METQHITFTEDDRSRLFAKTLKERVDAYFYNNGNRISKKGNWGLYIKTIIGFTANIGSFTKIIFFTPENLWEIIFLSIVFALSLPFLGFNVGHDAAHNSYSKKNWVNKILSHTFNWMGATVYEWKTKHNGAHHTNTNIEGHDDDHTAPPWFRMSPAQERKSYHAYQDLYATFFYSFLYIDWVIGKDFKKYKSKKVANTIIPNRNRTEKIIFWVTKFWWFILFIVLPIYVFGIWGLLWTIFVCLLCGLVLTLVFQPAHIVPKTVFPLPNENGQVNLGRKEHQIATTCDFGTDDKITTWLVGGLNFQIEHHLFPEICHIHYPKIHRIVKQVCREFGIVFNEYPSFASAITAHFQLLRQLGEAD